MGANLELDVSNKFLKVIKSSVQDGVKIDGGS